VWLYELVHVCFLHSCVRVSCVRQAQKVLRTIHRMIMLMGLTSISASRYALQSRPASNQSRRLGTHLQHGHIEGTASQVKHQDALVGLLVKAVCQGSGGGLVDDAQHIQTCNLASVLGGLCAWVCVRTRMWDA